VPFGLLLVLALLPAEGGAATDPAPDAYIEGYLGLGAHFHF
jgi:hypothetical protein